MESAWAWWGRILEGESPDFRRKELLSQEQAKKKICGDLAVGPTRRPRLGGGLRKAAPLYRRASLLGPQAALEAVLGVSWAVLGRYFGRYWVVLGVLGMS